MTLRDWLVALLATIIALCAVAAISGSRLVADLKGDFAKHQQYCDAYQKSEKKSEEKQECKSILYRAVTEPAAFATWALVLFTALLFIGTGGLFVYAVRQSRDTRNQLTLANPPNLELSFLHIWEQGSGNVFNPDNSLPDVSPGRMIEGAAFIGNFGRERATIQGSDIAMRFVKGPLTMNYPGWGGPGGNPLHLFDDVWGSYPIREVAKHLVPGERARWAFADEVPKGMTGDDLVVVGVVFYADRLNVHRQMIFAHRYIPGEGRFKVEYEQTS